VPELGAAPHFAWRCDCGRGVAHHRCGPVHVLWTPRRLQEQPSARLGHIAVHTGPHRATSCPTMKVIAGGTPQDKLLLEFQWLTKPTGSHREVRHNTTHHIRTTPSPPLACRKRRFAQDKLAVAKADFDAMLKEATARRVKGPWSSALHLVLKKGSVWKPCGDYRALNASTIAKRYPVSHIQDYTHRLSGWTPPKLTL